MENVVREIAQRTGGDVYIGVVGPVRTGKSTFIKRFMEKMVLPAMGGDEGASRVVDELPVSGAGKTIMTTQIQFVPEQAVAIDLGEGASARVRLVDCVGYLVRGALGAQEGEAARMVRTPWFDHDIPFEEAAEIGTRKVIRDYATLGVVVTSDGTVTDIPRSSYAEAEERAVNELKALGKPFVIVLNSAAPQSEQARATQKALAEKYGARVALMDVSAMDGEAAQALLRSLLMEFPLVEAFIALPAWVGALSVDHWLRQALIEAAGKAAPGIAKMGDYAALEAAFGAEGCSYTEGAQAEEVLPGEGRVSLRAQLQDGLFYKVLGEASGTQVEGEEHLLRLMCEMTQMKRAYDRVAAALQSVDQTGYGLVSPDISQLALEKPEIIKQGSRYGVSLKASAPSLHLIRVDIAAQVSPVVGTEQQSEELARYLLSEFENDPDSIWQTNIFGKPLADLMRDELSGKLSRMPGEVQEKLREAMTKIINEGNGGMICILL